MSVFGGSKSFHDSSGFHTKFFDGHISHGISSEHLGSTGGIAGIGFGVSVVVRSGSSGDGVIVVDLDLGVCGGVAIGIGFCFCIVDRIAIGGGIFVDLGLGVCNVDWRRFLPISAMARTSPRTMR